MMDDEIQETVESLLGKGVKIIDCEKKSSIKEEEVLLVNGCPIELEGEDGAAIREALVRGNIPDCDLLNQILVRAGILKAPVHLETSLQVKSTVSTREELTVAKDGRVVDERSRETKENNLYSSTSHELWEPVGMVHGAHLPRTGAPCPRPLFPFPAAAPPGKPPPVFRKKDEFYADGFMRDSVSGTTSTSECSSRSVDQVDQGKLANGLHAISLNPRSKPLPPLPPAPGESVNGGGYQGTLPPTPGYSANNIFGNVPHDSPANPNPPPPLSSSCRRSLPQTALSETATGVSLDSSCSTDLPIPSGVSEYDNALVFRDNILISGPLDALIQHLVPTTEYYPERSYVFAFLLSSRLFIRPHELLGQVIALCDAQQKLGDKQVSSKERLAKFIPRLVQLLAQWSETFPYDFRDERVMAHVRAITHRCVSVEAGVRHQVSSLLTNLLHRLTALEKYEEFLQKINDESSTNSIESLSSTDVIEMCPNAAELAQQLTHIELERLSFIGPEEFVQAFAKENPHVEPSLKEMKKTRNLEAYVQWFNRLSYFVATHICKHQKKKQRVRAVEYWIETARECFNIGNFNSLMAIIAGLNMSPISRLKKTWNKVQSAKFSVLEHQMDPSSNFSSYRSTLKAAMWRSAGATDLRQRIVIPFFSLLVKDLYFLNEGCSNKLRNGHINFKKFWELAKQVTEFISWKQVACPFEKNHKLIAFLQASPVLSENALALASFECEPPENNHEKERFKALKSGGAAS